MEFRSKQYEQGELNNIYTYFYYNGRNDTYEEEWWCFKNNIPIIRLNYKIKNIKLEDLIPETSDWLEVPWL